MRDNLQAANAVNETEGIATPIKINLQLFAEGDPIPSSDPDPSRSNEPSSDPMPSDPTPINDPVPTPQPSNEPTQTQAFARRLKEETQKAIDSEYDRLYGAEYGIHSKAEYDKAIADQQAAQQAEKLNIDPQFYNEFVGLKDKVTQFESEKQQLAQEKIFIQQDTALKNDPVTKDFYTQWESEIKANAKAYGCDLDTAFTLKVRKSLADITKGVATKAEQAAIQKIATNGASSPGSLAGNGENVQTFFTKEQVDKMSQEEVNKNYDTIIKSMSKW